jgi:general secretion pathway protein I
MRHRQAGFTLLEVMVAFIIAAFALAALYRGALGGLLSAHVATQYEEAISRAESRMATLGRGSELTPGEQSGADGGGFSFRTRVSAIAALPWPPGEAVPTLYAVRVVIAWGEGAAARMVQLDSQRVGKQVPAGP